MEVENSRNPMQARLWIIRCLQYAAVALALELDGSCMDKDCLQISLPLSHLDCLCLLLLVARRMLSDCFRRITAGILLV